MPARPAQQPPFQPVAPIRLPAFVDVPRARGDERGRHSYWLPAGRALQLRLKAGNSANLDCMFPGMVVIPAGMPLVDVTAPDGTKSVWAAAVSLRHAVAAVRQLIPADHVAELSNKRLPTDMLPWARRGDVRRIE
jgi:hypothetical protein